MRDIDIQTINTIAKEAGEIIMEIYQTGDFGIEAKSDDSPLTKADKAANEHICDKLRVLYSDIPIMSEENKQEAYEDRKDRERYWCVDPLDGTKEFIKQNGEFTVNIALIEKGIPVLGAVYAPALEELYYAQKGGGAFKQSAGGTQRLPVEKGDSAKILRVVASKSHLSEETKRFIDALEPHTQQIERTSKGSSLKLCMVAEGSADIYPRLAPTMEWDTAAAHAVVLEAGKGAYIYTQDSDPAAYLHDPKTFAPLAYNKPDLLNPFFVVV